MDVIHLLTGVILLSLLDGRLLPALMGKRRGEEKRTPNKFDFKINFILEIPKFWEEKLKTKKKHYLTQRSFNVKHK